MNSRLLLFGMAFPVFAAHTHAQWSASEPDALATPPSEQRSVYSIKKGDTLWDLAFQFLGDPFKWPELWHANGYIKNPNLIYPGNNLAIPGPGGKTSSAGAVPETESMSSLSVTASDGGQKENGSGVWGLSDKDNSTGSSDKFTDSLMSVTVFRNDFFSSDLIEKTGFLWFTRDVKGLIYPGNAAIAKAEENDPVKNDAQNIYRQFDEISIEVFGKNTYKVGDTVDVYHSDRLVKFKGKTANLVRRTGRAQVTRIASDRVRAILFKIWDVVSEGDRIDSTAHTPSREIDTLIDRDVAIRGTVFDRIEPTESPYLYQTILCDRGTQDGVRFGDVFLIRSAKNIGRPSALGCIIHVGSESSTLVIEKLFDIAVVPGDTLELTKRIRFK